MLPHSTPPQALAKSKHQTHRGIGAIILSAVPGLITLAVESLSSYIKGWQQKCIDDAVLAMRQDRTAIRNRLQQYSNDFVKYNVETLGKVIDTVNSLHQRQTQMEKIVSDTQFGQIADAMEALTFNFDLQLFLKLAQEEHVTQYHLLERSARDLLGAVAILSQGQLPQVLFPDHRLKTMLHEVETMIKKHYPDYELTANHISHYRDMELVTFAVDQSAHALIVAFPAFVKNYRKPSLSLFQVETVPVPILDENKNANSYSRVCIL